MDPLDVCFQWWRGYGFCGDPKKEDFIGFGFSEEIGHLYCPKNSTTRADTVGTPTEKALAQQTSR